MKKIRRYFSEFCSPWLKKILNFDIPKSVKMKKKLRGYFSKFCSPWLKKISNFNILKSTKMKEFKQYICESSFTMVEENYEIYSCQMLQIYSKQSDLFTVIEKMSKFNLSKYFKLILNGNIFHLVRRKN